MITLRPEQSATIEKALAIIQRYNLVYLACEPRTGKTLMGLTIAKELGWKKVGFITKKIAIGSIESDHSKSGYELDLIIKNFERILELPKNCDGYIVDEAHGVGSYPKPNLRAKSLKEVVGSKPIILMSGTPNPESYSQLFHQMWISHYNPFVYKNFYKWAADYVDIKKKFVNGFQLNDYSHAKRDKIMEVMNHYMVNLSQADSGFTAMVDEEVFTVVMRPETYNLLKILKDKKVVTLNNSDVLIADTPVRMQNLFHQISSGTVIAERDSYIFDKSKAEFIKQKFTGKHIAIFYKFIKEGELLRQTFPNFTESPEEFNLTDKTFIRQFISGREGANLNTADALVAYNIDFSATTYFQFKERSQSKERVANSKLVWIFSDRGIEPKIYKMVNNKKGYTLDYFLKDFGIKRW